MTLSCDQRRNGRKKNKRNDPRQALNVELPPSACKCVTLSSEMWHARFFLSGWNPPVCSARNERIILNQASVCWRSDWPHSNRISSVRQISPKTFFGFSDRIFITRILVQHAASHQLQLHVVLSSERSMDYWERFSSLRSASLQSHTSSSFVNHVNQFEWESRSLITLLAFEIR